MGRAEPAVPAERRRARGLSRGGVPVPARRGARARSRLAVRRRHAQAAGRSTTSCTTSSTPTTRQRAAHLPRSLSRRAARQRRQAALPAHRHDELRRRPRERVPSRGRGLRSRLLHRRRRAPREVPAHLSGGDLTADRAAERVPPAVAGTAHGDPQDPRRDQPRRRRRGQLRHHRGRLHRLPHPHRRLRAAAGDAAGEDGPEQLPVPRLRHARLEPARDPPPDLGRAQAPQRVVGGPGRAGGDRDAVLEGPRRRHPRHPARALHRRAADAARARFGALAA